MSKNLKTIINAPRWWRYSREESIAYNIYTVSGNKFNKKIIKAFIDEFWHGNINSFTGVKGENYTMLGIVINQFRPQPAKILLKLGADIKLVAKKGSPLLHEICNQRVYVWSDAVSRVETIKFLLKNGIDVNSFDADGNSALVYLLENFQYEGHSVEAIKTLLDFGANPFLVNPRTKKIPIEDRIYGGAYHYLIKNDMDNCRDINKFTEYINIRLKNKKSGRALDTQGPIRDDHSRR